MAKRENDNKRHFSKANLKENKNGYRLELNFGDLGDKLDAAQYALDTAVWNDVKNYMPIDTGNLINQTNALNAVTSKKVYLYAPNLDYGHYQHEGIVYVDPQYGYAAMYNEATGQFWSRPGVQKVPSDRKLQYKNPNAEAHWGEAAYINHKEEWVNVVERVINS